MDEIKILTRQATVMQKKWPGALPVPSSSFSSSIYARSAGAARGLPPLRVGVVRHRRKARHAAARAPRRALEAACARARPLGRARLRGGRRGAGALGAVRLGQDLRGPSGRRAAACKRQSGGRAQRPPHAVGGARQPPGLRAGRQEPLSAFFGLRPTTLIVDDMDVPLRHAEDRAECLRALVADSRETRRFNVLLLVTSWEWAAELRALGATLTAEELRGLLGTASDDAIVAAAAVAGTPGGARLLRRDRAPLRGARPPHRRGVATRHRGPAAAR